MPADELGIQGPSSDPIADLLRKLQKLIQSPVNAPMDEGIRTFALAEPGAIGGGSPPPVSVPATYTVSGGGVTGAATGGVNPSHPGARFGANPHSGTMGLFAGLGGSSFYGVNPPGPVGRGPGFWALDAYAPGNAFWRNDWDPNRPGKIRGESD